MCFLFSEQGLTKNIRKVLGSKIFHFFLEAQEFKQSNFSLVADVSLMFFFYVEKSML